MNERDLFIAALEKPIPADRAAFLDEACGGNGDLCAQVVALLLEHEQLGSFLEAPADLGGTTCSHLAVERAGGMIGPYKLLQELGEGGMGIVFMAEQEQPVRRRVALKIIKPGMDSTQVIARFEAERQALALMDHQHIARVLDVGTTKTGRPYFVMELVKGMAITEYCDKNQLSPRERLELFVPVCQAIQHAHQKGIIHRDIKPSNVMVTLYDGKPVPKVIDFGVAKAIGQRLTERTMFTAFGQLVGTLEYMSPEQAELSGLDVDTRSDIYALGILAYELLTGSTPLQWKALQGAAFDEILRMIREVEPPKPSTRLSDSDETLATISAHRRTEPAQLTRLVRGELDWIVMKALDKDRSRRYETASALARDIERYLHDEPVEACPPSVRYRLGKFLRGHKRSVLAASLVLLTLVSGIIGTTWSLLRAENARQGEADQRQIAQDREAEAIAGKAAALKAAADERQARIREAEQRKLAEANEKKAVTENQIAISVRTFLQRDLLRQADPTAQANMARLSGGGFEAQENPTIKELLDRASTGLAPEKLEATFPGQKEVQASILRTVGDTYNGVGAYDKAAEFLARASDLFRDALGDQDSTTLSTLNNLGTAYLASMQLPQAIAIFEKQRVDLAKTLADDHRDVLRTKANLGVAYMLDGKSKAGIVLLEQVRDVLMKLDGPTHSTTLITLINLAGAYQFADRLPQAIQLFEQVRDIKIEQVGANHPDTLRIQDGLALAYHQSGKLLQAVKLFEQVSSVQAKLLGGDHPDTLSTQHHLAVAYVDLGRLPQAIELLENVSAARVRRLGAGHPATQMSQYRLATAYIAFGRAPQAIALYELLIPASVKTLGADHPHTLTTMNNLGLAYQKKVSTLPKAIEIHTQVHAAQVKKIGADNPETIATLNFLAQAYYYSGKYQQALPLFQQAFAAIEKVGFQSTNTHRTFTFLVACHERLKQFTEAEALQRKWLALEKQRHGSNSPEYASELKVLGWNLLKQEKWVEAESSLRESLAFREKLVKNPVVAIPPRSRVFPWDVTEVRSLLGAALAGQKKYADAEPLLLASATDLVENEKVVPTSSKYYITDSIRRLIALYDETGKKDDAEKWRKKLAEATKPKGHADP